MGERGEGVGGRGWGGVMRGATGSDGDEGGARDVVWCGVSLRCDARERHITKVPSTVWGHQL